MLTKCICTNCAGHLEFEEENAGERIPCPHCGFQTTLALPGTRQPDAEVVSWMRKRDIRRLLFLLACAGLAVAAFSYGLYRWGVPWVEDFLPAVDTTTKAVLVLLLMLLMAPFAMFWLIFPVLLFLQLRKLTNVLSELAENAGFVSPDLNELDDELRETEQEQEDQANEPL